MPANEHRKIQHVGNMIQQSQSPGLDKTHDFALLGLQISHLQKLRHAQDGIQGGSQLMAHIAQ